MPELSRTPVVRGSFWQALPEPIEPPAETAPDESAELPDLRDDIVPLRAARTQLNTTPGELPIDHARQRIQGESPVIGGSLEDRRPVSMVYFYQASALCFGPIYFEDVNLERYGYSHGVLQPAVSAIHFFGTIPILPYKMGIHRPDECIYTLGYYRPGSNPPYQTSRLGWSWRGALLEAEAIAAFILWIPSGKLY